MALTIGLIAIAACGYLMWCFIMKIRAKHYRHAAFSFLGLFPVAFIALMGFVANSEPDIQRMYEIASETDIYEGVLIKIKVAPGLSKEQLKKVIQDVARRDGRGRVAVGVYQIGEDETKSGYTAAMGERKNEDDEWKYEFADAYLHPEKHTPPSIVGESVQLQAGASVSNAPDIWLYENILLTVAQPTTAKVIDQKTYHLNAGSDLTRYRVQIEKPAQVSGWVMQSDFQMK